MKGWMFAIALLISGIMAMPIAAGNEDVPGDDIIETAFYGTVTDNVTGGPIQDVRITAYDSDYEEYATDLTDGKGEYYIEFNMGGNFLFFVEKDDYVDIQTTQSAQIDENVHLDFRMDPIPFDHRIFGTVRDSETGLPLSGVDTQLWEVSPDGGLRPLKDVATDDGGQYSFKVNDGMYEIWFYRSGYYEHIEEDVQVSGQDLELNVMIEPWPQGVYGLVTDENGDPMPGIVVQLANDYYDFQNVTDGEGRFEIRAYVPGDYTLSAFADGHRPYYREVNVERDVMLEFDIQMAKAYIPDPILRVIYRILTMIGAIDDQTY